MLWNLDLKGVVVLACNVAGIGVISTALNVVGVLVTMVTIIGADDPRIEAKNVLKDWAINKIADRLITAAAGAIL